MRLEDKLDIRFVKVKLKEFERKELIQYKEISGEKCYRMLEKKKPKYGKTSKKNEVKPRSVSKKKEVKRAPILRKKEIKFSPASKKKEIKHKRVSKKEEPPVNYGLDKIHFFTSEERINKHKEYLKKHPNDEKRKDLLIKDEKYQNKIKKKLENHSFFFCQYCKLFIKGKTNMTNHMKVEHKNVTNQPYKCSYCNIPFKSESDVNAHERHHEFDLHGFYLEDAILIVKEKLIECNARGHSGLKLVHGYRHGRTLKDYFRSKAFVEYMRNAGFEISFFRITDPGTTGIRFKFKNKKN